MTHESDVHIPERADNGLIFACHLDGEGSAEFLSWKDLETWRDKDEPIWVHLDLSVPYARDWLRNKSMLSEITSGALLTTDSRPRVFYGKTGFVTILRGIDSNPGAEPEDMLALRLWSDGHRVISMQEKSLSVTQSVAHLLFHEKDGPKTAADLYAHLIARLTELIGVTVDTVENDLNVLEDIINTDDPSKLRIRVADMRRKLADLRRYIAPQRDALGAFLIHPPQWFDNVNCLRLREINDRTLHYIEEIDNFREQALVLRDEANTRLSEASNRTLYVLALLSAVFLPLSFLTGLFGINVGGIPGVNDDNAFAVFSTILVILLLVELVILKRLKLL